MGTHPIFESDFDCLTDSRENFEIVTKMSVHVPIQSNQVPVTSIRNRITKVPVGEARQALERNGTTKSQDSLRDDDSLTSLEWLSALGNPTSASLLPPPTEPVKQSNPKDLILLAFRLGRQPSMTVDEIYDMTFRLNSKVQKSAILEELSISQEFISTPAGWKLASNGMPPVAKKRKFEISYDISNATQNSEQQPQSTIDIVIDRSQLKRVNQAPFCPDLSELLNEIGIPTPSQNMISSQNPLMHNNDHSVPEASMATHLPQLELVGERIPTPLDWSRSPEEQNSPSPQSNEELFITDVETPYLVESWLQDTFLDYST